MARPKHRDTGKWGPGTWLVVVLLVAGGAIGARYAWPHLRPLLASITGGLSARVEARLVRSGRPISPGQALGVEQALAGDVIAFQVTHVDQPFLGVRLCPPGAAGASCELLLHGPTPGEGAWMASAAQLQGGLYHLELLACPGQPELEQALAGAGPPPPGCSAQSLEIPVRP